MRYLSLTRNNDFTRAYRRGKSTVHPAIVVYINKNRVGATRVGITCSKKVGNAVVRNRARRLIRHALYEVLPENIGGLDLVFVARGQTLRYKSQELAEILYKILRAAGLAIPERGKQ